MKAAATIAAVQATTDNVREGSIVIADGGFTCLEEGARLIVRSEDGTLFVNCADGRHALDGQLDEGDDYIGLSVEVPA